MIHEKRNDIPKLKFYNVIEFKLLKRFILNESQTLGRF